MEPTGEERKTVSNAIKDFIRKKQRKIYGGFALNSLIKQKNPKDAFYTELDTPDIEFYSPEPLQDLVELCDFFKKNYKFVQGREAQHKETYSLFVNMTQYCDISYVPKLIYHRIPYITIDNLFIVDPSFLLVDVFRVYTDPITSFTFRLDKVVTRGNLLQKHYPIKIIKQPQSFPEKQNPKLKEALKLTFDFLLNRESVITFGYYAYYFYLNEGKIPDLSQIPYLDIITTMYVTDTYDLINMLKRHYPETEKITVEEYYPFFQFYGHKATILLDKIPLINIYHHNNRCTPYQDISVQNKKLRIASFMQEFMMSLILVHKARVDKNKDLESNNRYMFGQLLKARTDYLRKNKKSPVDPTIYKEFQVDCVGMTIDPPRLFRLNIENNREKGKPFTFTYNPLSSNKESVTDYQFLNTSGNIIKSDKNKKIRMESVDSHESIKTSKKDT